MPNALMTDLEMIAAIEALGWHGLTVRSDRVVGYHATRPKGWQEVHAPAPGRSAVLASFLRNIQNPEILAQYP